MNYKPDFLVTPYILIEDKEVTKLDERVYSVIYYFHKMRGEECIASNETISKIAKSTASSVANSISRLIKLGYVQGVYQGDKKMVRKSLIPLIGMAKLSPASDTLHSQVKPLSPSSDTPLSLPSEQIRNNNISKSNKDIYTIVFDYWNDQKVTIHKKVTSDMKRYIDTFLRDRDEEDILQAITNYAEIYHSPATYWSHKWTLEEFLSRKNGARVFLSKSISDYADNTGAVVGMI